MMLHRNPGIVMKGGQEGKRVHIGMVMGEGLQWVENGSCWRNSTKERML
jgi:hypothetical protein